MSAETTRLHSGPAASDRLLSLQHAIEHAAHLLPSQGPISVFVHHNTLHAFEDLPFEQAVREGAALYRCEPYLAEEQYRRELSRGRIRPSDLSAVLLEDLGDKADGLIGFMGTRYHLRLAMLQSSLREGPDAEVRWLVDETDALQRFCRETPAEIRDQTIEETRRWMMRDLRNGDAAADDRILPLVASLKDQFRPDRRESWSAATWEAFTLHLLWRVCHHGAHGVKRFAEPVSSPERHRDLLLEATGHDADELVHEILVPYCAAFLDQGFATWLPPQRDAGFLASFVATYAKGLHAHRWLRDLPRELAQLRAGPLSPLESIDNSLTDLGIPAGEQQEYLTQTLLALRGWTGMIWQMETNAEWTARPAPAGTLVEYLAVRLVLDRLAAAFLAQEQLGEDVPLAQLRSVLRHRISHPQRVSVDQRAYLIFQLAQVRGWTPRDLHMQSKAAWSRLVEEIEAFDSHERRRIYHLAYERRYRNQTLDALYLHASTRPADPAYQVACCIDEREESLRRHLEEVDPSCETFGVAGFYGVAMYYRGVTEAHYRPLCPVNIKPRHFVQEESAFSLQYASLRQAERRRRLGEVSHRIHVGTRTLLGGFLTGLLGSLATFPLVMRILFPRATAQLRGHFRRIMIPPATQLRLERIAPEPGDRDDQIGFSVDEMVAIVKAVLTSMGLTQNMAPLVIIMGHGSASLNNPHEPAHDCGACGGGHGGPNARAFAQMANDPRVRRGLDDRGLPIPQDVFFVGAYHNTCDDAVTYYDLDRLPVALRATFVTAREAIDEARRRDAHERCRRFDSASLTASQDIALRHVEGRSEDLSQTRPEYGHATNAICIVGRRSRTKGLFLDRRTFLTSYDPTQDDEQQSVLANILQAVIPVCAGINLEYYFSFVDPSGYGCGTKLPHNITSLLGVMDGAASDLRPGLPWQMVEIHEPVRILFIIETTPDAMLSIVESNEAIRRLVRNEWVQLATMDPGGANFHLFSNGRFVAYEPEATTLPQVASSLEWYRGQRDHLAYAQVVSLRAVSFDDEEAA